MLRPGNQKKKKRGGNVAEETIRKKDKNKAPHLENQKKKKIKNKRQHCSGKHKKRKGKKKRDKFAHVHFVILLSNFPCPVFSSSWRDKFCVCSDGKYVGPT